jgi:hypothetical protein
LGEWLALRLTIPGVEKGMEKLELSSAHGIYNGININNI